MLSISNSFYVYLLYYYVLKYIFNVEIVGHPLEILYFAAQTIRTKIAYDFLQFPKEFDIFSLDLKTMNFSFNYNSKHFI